MILRVAKDLADYVSENKHLPISHDLKEFLGELPSRDGESIQTRVAALHRAPHYGRFDFGTDLGSPYVIEVRSSGMKFETTDAERPERFEWYIHPAPTEHGRGILVDLNSGRIAIASYPNRSNINVIH